MKASWAAVTDKKEPSPMFLTFLAPVSCHVYKMGRVDEIMARVPTNCSVLLYVGRFPRILCSDYEWGVHLCAASLLSQPRSQSGCNILTTVH